MARTPRPRRRLQGRASPDVVVGTGELSKDVAAVKAWIASKGHPRIYALIREQSLEELKGAGTGKDKPNSVASLSQGVVEQGLISHMRPLGWKFVDPEVASGKVHVENALTTDLGSLNGRDFATTGADYVILGLRDRAPRAEHRSSSRANAPRRSDPHRSLRQEHRHRRHRRLRSRRARWSQARSPIRTRRPRPWRRPATSSPRRCRSRFWRPGGREPWAPATSTSSPRSPTTTRSAPSRTCSRTRVSGVKSVDEVSFNDGKADLSVVTAGANTKQLAERHLQQVGEGPER